MTRAQKTAYQEGFDDRMGHQPMRESWTLSPHIANAYTNGYRDASRNPNQDDGAGADRAGWYE